MLRFRVIPSFLALVFLLVACARSTPEPVQYNIDMTEYAYTPDIIEAKVGQQLTLKLTNKGTLEHEIMFGRNAVKSDGKPDGYLVDLFEATGVEPEVSGQAEATGDEHEMGHSGFMVTLPNNGDQAAISFQVTKDMIGEWEIGCFSQEGVHYDAGMKGKLIVSP